MNEQLKKYWWLILLILLVIAGGGFLLSSSSVKEPLIDNIPSAPTTAVELEYLSSTELGDLGVDPSTKAQIIHRDPLVYKLIKDESDVISDLREIDNFPY